MKMGEKLKEYWIIPTVAIIFLLAFWPNQNGQGTQAQTILQDLSAKSLYLQQMEQRIKAKDKGGS